MKTHLKIAGVLAALAWGCVLLGGAGCSNDGSSSDSTPVLFTPTAGSTAVTAPYRIDGVPDAPMPKSATLYLVDVRLNLDSLKDADFMRYEIAFCTVSVSYGGQELVSDASILDAQNLSPCRTGLEKSDDIGTFLIGTPKKTGSLTFSIKMHDSQRKLLLQGQTAALPVQPGPTPVSQDLVALPVP